MSYYVKFNDITSMQGQTNQTIQQWGESLKNLQESIASLANQSELQGEAMTSAKSYMTEVHGTFIQTLTLLMNEYIASFLLYKDGYYQIDTHNHAELPEDVYKGLHSDLGKSKQRFEQQLEQLTTAKLRVAGLVNYQGTSHTKTKFTYEKLMKDIKHLDESISQYEEMHARQDLQAFKELLAATKSLLAEHSSRDRSMGSYQVGDFRQLPSMNRFMLAVQQSETFLNNHMPQFQAAQEREKVRVYAEERTKQGAMELVFGVLTFVVGGSALFMSGGTMWPIVTFAFKSGALALSLSGGSKSIEAVQNIYYGLSGDGKSVAVNPIRDTYFVGKGELYHSLEQIFGLTTGVFIPIAQTKSIVQGLWQFTWGTIGGLATGQAAYHGTKLLGGSEETAQMMNLFGNLVGGYKFAKAVKNFSLNGKTVPKVEIAEFEKEIQSKYVDIDGYEYNALTNPGPLSELESMPIKTFYGGRYNKIEFLEDTILYRGGNNKNPLGQWFTKNAPASRAQVRIDTAVKDIWLETDGSYSGQSAIDKVYKILIPKGTIGFEGPVGNQGGIYQGGLSKQQIFIETPWEIEGVKVLDSWIITH